MGFDSKCEFVPPTILLGLLLGPWVWGISSQPLQHPPSYWGFSDLGHGVSPHSCSLQQSAAAAPVLALHIPCTDQVLSPLSTDYIFNNKSSVTLPLAQERQASLYPLYSILKKNNPGSYEFQISNSVPVWDFSNCK